MIQTVYVDIPQTLEEAFWPKVWQCTHHQPCKKCCWPWKSVDCMANLRSVWKKHIVFYHRAFPINGVITTPAHRMAYELTRGFLAMRGVGLHVCHQCHFGPCCNGWHVLPGSPSDNREDNRRRSPRHQIVLPDGRIWSYAEAQVTTTRKQKRSAEVYVKTLTPAQAAELLGVNVKTLQRWERTGRLCPISRTQTNRRVYTLAQVRAFQGLDSDGEPLAQSAPHTT